MKEGKEDKEIRSYLLGELENGEQERVEKRLLGEEEFFERLLVAEDEIIEDYLEGALSERERGQFESHFLKTPERQKKLRFSAALRRHAEASAARTAPPPAPARDRVGLYQRLFGMSALRLAAAAAVVILAGVGLYRLFIYESDIERGLAALNKAMTSGERPVEARMTGMDYAPYSSTRGGPQEKVDKDSLRRAERLIGSGYDEEASPEARHAMGRLHLARREFNDAIEQLEAALAAKPNDAQVQNDLGAAYLEKAKATQGRESAEALDRALALFDGALRANDSLLSAIFNRALARERLKAYDQAAQDWQLYIDKETDPRWKQEAEQGLRRIQGLRESSSRDPKRLHQEFFDAHERRDDARAWDSLRQTYRSTGNQITETLIDEYLASLERGQSADAGAKARQLNYAA